MNYNNNACDILSEIKANVINYYWAFQLIFNIHIFHNFAIILVFAKKIITFLVSINIIINKSSYKNASMNLYLINF